MNGFRSVFTTRNGDAVANAVGIGRAMARFFGTSSATTISNVVAASRAQRGPQRDEPSDGVRNPTNRDVIVMPSWAPDNWKERVLSAARVRGCALVALFRHRFDLAAVDRYETELGCDEECVSEDEQKDCEQP